MPQLCTVTSWQSSLFPGWECNALYILLEVNLSFSSTSGIHSRWQADAKRLQTCFFSVIGGHFSGFAQMIRLGLRTSEVQTHCNSQGQAFAHCWRPLRTFQSTFLHQVLWTLPLATRELQHFPEQHRGYTVTTPGEVHEEYVQLQWHDQFRALKDAAMQLAVLELVWVSSRTSLYWLHGEHRSLTFLISIKQTINSKGILRYFQK